LYMHQGNTKQAILFLQQGVNMDPLNLERQANLASALRQDGQLDKAEQIFRHVNAIQPNAPAYNGLGTVEISRNNLPAAHADFNRALQLDPLNMEAQYNLGLYCAQTHDAACAVSAFKSFLAKASPEYQEEVPQAEYDLGMACAETKDIPCVRSSLQAFVANKSPRYQAMMPQANYYLGVACARLHDPACARAAFQSFLSAVPATMQSIVPLAQFNLGTACAQTHDIACARTAFQAFLANVPPAYESLVPQAQANLNALH